jgi:hypothetical protein
MPGMQDLHDAIAALWQDARPRLLARVAALDAAASGSLDEPARRQALIEAHTLTGTLGAFGRADASEAARSAEHALEAGDRAALPAAVRTLQALT